MKYAASVECMFAKEEFYQLFGLSETECERYKKYNENFICYVYGNDGYNHVLEKYKKNTINVCDSRVIQEIKAAARQNIGNEVFFEDKIYHMLLENIKEHQQFYDDYKKFFQVTDKLKELQARGYLLSKEFYEEFSAYIKSFYEMLEYYNNQVLGKQKILDELLETVDQKSEENKKLAEKYSRDYQILTDQTEKLMKKNIDLEQRLEYIQSSKIYKAFLSKKVEERFG
jgi:hypothetical protein